ncbi:WD40-repeat-containing domain protein [Phycomyces blakesleeanus]|uniref:WD40-repeat-containing domain protein n=2 Tax=Phycomyces blakesleeanus TaxID=4837 RepID=A0ABR3BFW1_PHYBL
MLNLLQAKKKTSTSSTPSISSTSFRSKESSTRTNASSLKRAPSASLLNTHRPNGTLKRTLSASSQLNTYGKEWLESTLTSKTRKIDNDHQNSDRCMATLSSGDIASTQFHIERKDNPISFGTSSILSHNESIAAACGIVSTSSILQYQNVPPKNKNNNPVFETARGYLKVKPRRNIPEAPVKILDSPYMVDDYYLNLLGWSCHNVVAVALERSVYLWNAETGTANVLDEDPKHMVTSVSWSADGTLLAVGDETGETQIWDVYRSELLRSMGGPTCRVGVLAWNKCTVSSGAYNGVIYNHDVRIEKHNISEFKGHDEEVCGLEWRSDGEYIASGGNDNILNVWDPRQHRNSIMSRQEHKSAVKAIAWCPWNLPLLATGGGRDDKKIHFWDATKNTKLNTINAGSQITSLRWSHHYKEIVSTHGLPNNNLTIWEYPTCNKIADIHAHESRILHSALSPDGELLATSSADENLKFWNVFKHNGSEPLITRTTKPSSQLRRTNSLR